jgi:hypothetical protein
VKPPSKRARDFVVYRRLFYYLGAYFLGDALGELVYVALGGIRFFGGALGPLIYELLGAPRFPRPMFSSPSLDLYIGLVLLAALAVYLARTPHVRDRPGRLWFAAALGSGAARALFQAVRPHLPWGMTVWTLAAALNLLMAACWLRTGWRRRSPALLAMALVVGGIGLRTYTLYHNDLLRASRLGFHSSAWELSNNALNLTGRLAPVALIRFQERVAIRRPASAG